MIVAVCATSLGCATIFKGSNEKVSFSAEPESASVYVNGMYTGAEHLEHLLRING